MPTQFPHIEDRKRVLTQSGINMVDLMMWLVIAALLLAAALQGIGFYQHRSFIEQMTNDAKGAGTNAVARVSMVDGKITEGIIREAVKETATTGEVSLVSADLGNGYYAIEAIHPNVKDYRVIYSFNERNDLRPGVNLKKMESIDLGSSASSSQCADDTWFAQYYSEYQVDGVPTESPELERCETANIAYAWNDGAPAVAGMPSDSFSIHWTKNFNVPTAAEFEFKISSDNKAWVYLDGKQIIDNSRWYAGVTTQKAYVRLTPGKHNVTIRYNEYTGGAAVYYTQTPVG